MTCFIAGVRPCLLTQEPMTSSTLIQFLVSTRTGDYFISLAILNIDLAGYDIDKCYHQSCVGM